METIMKNNNIFLTAVLVIIVGAGGFFAGMKYQEIRQPSRADFQARMGMRQGSPGGQRPVGSETVRGEIMEKDEKSITVKSPDNSSKIILILENTAINKATEGSIDDLKTGEQVMVFGKSNSDGSISATNIQLGSGFRPGRTPEAN